jgi:hypothetical protein
VTHHVTLIRLQLLADDVAGEGELAGRAAPDLDRSQRTKPLQDQLIFQLQRGEETRSDPGHVRTNRTDDVIVIPLPSLMDNPTGLRKEGEKPSIVSHCSPGRMRGHPAPPG